MQILLKLFGEGKDLNTLQMCDRAIVICFIALLLIRLSGRRTFGKKTPFDNTIVIILGAVLSRAVTGASPFIPTIASSLVLVLLHRILSWLVTHNTTIRHILEGQSVILYQNNRIERKNLNKCLISESELLGDVRSKANAESFDQVDKVFMETSGEISVINKGKQAIT